MEPAPLQVNATTHTERLTYDDHFYLLFFIIALKFSMTVHRNPPLMTPEEYRVSDEALAQLQATIMDKAKKRLENETCVRIFKRLDQLEAGHFIACRAPGTYRNLTCSFHKMQSLKYFASINDDNSYRWRRGAFLHW
jgi:hypothetical protein